MCWLVAGATCAQEWLEQAHVLYLRGDLHGAQRVLDRAGHGGTLPARLEQALIWDAGGHHAQARALYDSLIGTPWEAGAAVPSAVNRVALGEWTAAMQQFDAIATRGAHPADRDYARLWLLRLMAQQPPNTRMTRTWTLESNPAPAYQRALMDLYLGRGEVRTALAALDGMHADSELARQNARTETLFFIAGYQQYVLKQPRQALGTYRQAWPGSSGALEHPLIQQAIEQIQSRTER